MADNEALRLADALETPAIEAGAFKHEVVAELRRLAGIEAKRDALLVALKLIAATDPVDAALDPERAARIANAALAKVGGGNG